MVVDAREDLRLDAGLGENSSDDVHLTEFDRSSSHPAFVSWRLLALVGRGDETLSREHPVDRHETRGLETFTRPLVREAHWSPERLREAKARNRRLALTVELVGNVVGLVRIELTTSSLSVTRSNRLSYSPQG